MNLSDLAKNKKKSDWIVKSIEILRGGVRLILRPDFEASKGEKL